MAGVKTFAYLGFTKIMGDRDSYPTLLGIVQAHDNSAIIDLKEKYDFSNRWGKGYPTSTRVPTTSCALMPLNG